MNRDLSPVDFESSFCALERRLLMSGAFASLNAHGTLSVAGTGKNDAIVVQFSGAKVQAVLNGATLSFAKLQVKRISRANGFGGNDRLSNKTNLPSTLIGSSGDDTMVGGSANDSLDGGEGLDTVDYSARSGNWRFGTPFSLADEGAAQLGNENDTISDDVEVYIGSRGDDEMTVVFFDHGFTVHGGLGNDHFYLGNAGERATVYGEAGNDIFDMSDEQDIDVMYGGPGNDVEILNELAGGQFFDGGPGTDSVNAAGSMAGGVSIAGDPSVEQILGVGGSTGTNPYLVTGNDLDNLIVAYPNSLSPLTINGGGGNDTIIGGPGNDQLNGEAGNDKLFGGDGNDTLIGGPGKDSLDGQAGSDVLTQ